MEQITHQTIIDLIPAYALNNLQAEEAEMVAQHLQACAVCRAELAAYERVVDALPLAAAEVEPSAELKGQLIQEIQNTGQTAVPTPQTAPTSWQQFLHALSGFFAGPRWQPVGAVVILALLIGGFFVWRQTHVPAAQFVLTATEAAPGAQGIIEVVGNDGRQATLTVTGLPALDPANQYQLWLIQDGQRISGGVFSVQTDGSQTITIHAPQPLPAYAAFGVTIEPAGGSPGPTGERVLGFNL